MPQRNDLQQHEPRKTITPSTHTNGIPDEAESAVVVKYCDAVRRVAVLLARRAQLGEETAVVPERLKVLKHITASIGHGRTGSAVEAPPDPRGNESPESINFLQADDIGL